MIHEPLLTKVTRHYEPLAAATAARSLLKEMCESAWNWQSNNPYGYEDGPGKDWPWQRIAARHLGTSSLQPEKNDKPRLFWSVTDGIAQDLSGP